jgi:phosphoserine phosphatase
VYIISGGYQLACEILGDYLGIPRRNIYAVRLTFDDAGNYVDFDRVTPLTRTNGKLTLIKQLALQGKTAFIGDSVLEMEVKEAVDLVVGYCGVIDRQLVRERADICVTKFADLETVLLSRVIVDA